MLDRIRPRLTYANVMSSIAVFGVLAGGGAWAHGKIGSKQLKRNAVATKHIKNKAVKTPKIANNAVNNRRLHPSVKSRWAVVDADGNLVRGRGAVGDHPAFRRTNDGEYVVIFDRDVRGCAYTATLTRRLDTGVSNGHIMVESAFGTPNGVEVGTFSGGWFSNDRLSAPFHLHVEC